MELTQEQYDIINSTGNIKINAVAGSGKTTTIIEYANTRPKNSKILYLAFNRSVRVEAEKKFKDKGLLNVRVETAHSLAYKNVVFKYDYKVRSQAYRTYEIKELLKIHRMGDKIDDLIIANHIGKFFSYYCNSEIFKFDNLNYLDVVSDEKTKDFVGKYYDYIAQKTRELLHKMNDGEIEITHDFYLKKFQLSKPTLNFDYILFDEGQDASPVMLDIFLKQNSTKVIVGDIYQQIYGWRYAVNSLAKTDFKTFNLTSSFRFHQDIADLASSIIERKQYLGEDNSIEIKGIGKNNKIKSKAIIARTNLGLLLEAIEFVSSNNRVNKIYFEGNINSYTYAEEGTSLYDILNLYLDKRHLIRDKLIQSMANIDELKEYIDKTEDMQLSIMVEIVKEYEDSIPEIINSIKNKHVGDGEKDKAQMIFSTVHRCKGMEYDSVQIVNDFLSEEKLLKIVDEGKEGEINIPKLSEEINLLYVAVTRTKNILKIPLDLMPDIFPSSSYINPTNDIKTNGGNEKKANKKNNSDYEKNNNQKKSYTFAEKREKYSSAYQPWTEKDDADLKSLYERGISIDIIAKRLARSQSAINTRIRKLDMYDFF